MNLTNIQKISQFIYKCLKFNNRERHRIEYYLYIYKRLSIDGSTTVASLVANVLTGLKINIIY